MSRQRHGGWASWAPSGRGAVPLIVLLVNVANLVGVATVTLLLIGVSHGSDDTGRAAVLWTALGYTVVALPVGTLIGMRRQRVTNAWLMAGRDPTSEEAAHALQLPVDTAIVAGVIWSVAAVLIGVVSAAVFPDARVGFRTGIATLLGGVVTAGVTYLLVARAARAVTARALAAHPPAPPPAPGRPPARRPARPRCPPAPAAHLGSDQRRATARPRPARRRPEQ